MQNVDLDLLVNELWKVYDNDENGYLDKEESKILVKDLFEAQGQKLNNKQLENILQLIDSNGDGKMDKKEIKKLLS